MTVQQAPPKQPYTSEDYLREYDSIIDQIAGIWTAQAAAGFAAWQAGQLTTPEWRGGMGHIMMRIFGDALGAGAGLAGRYLWFTHDINPYHPAAPVHFDNLDVDLAAELERVEKATETLAADLDRDARNLAERLDRLVINETAKNLARGAQQAAQIVGIDGYVRGLEPDACELCQWLYRRGYVYPADQPMHRHTGCRCAPIPTPRKETR